MAATHSKNNQIVGIEVILAAATYQHGLSAAKENASRVIQALLFLDWLMKRHQQANAHAIQAILLGGCGGTLIPPSAGEAEDSGPS